MNAPGCNGMCLQAPVALFGLLYLWIAWRQPGLLNERPVVALCLAGPAAWLAIPFPYMDYWEPKANAAIFAALLIAAISTAPGASL